MSLGLRSLLRVVKRKNIGPRETDHRSWCGHYIDYREQVARCVAWNQRPRLPLNRDMMQQVCQAECGGDSASVLPFRNDQGALVAMLTTDATDDNCQHASKRLINADGVTLLAEMDMKEGPDRQTRFEQRYRFMVAGLKATKAIPCETAFLPPPPAIPPKPVVTLQSSSIKLNQL